MRKRSDSNQNEIVKLAKELGASVFITSSVGHGFPDLVIGFKGINYLVEVKNNKIWFTHDEDKFIKNWNGSHNVVTCENDLLNMLGFVCKDSVKNQLND